MGYGTVNTGYPVKTGKPGGVASLDETGKVPAEQLPPYDPSGAATNAVNEHNKNPYAHPEIQAAMVTAAVQITYNGGES